MPVHLDIDVWRGNDLALIPFAWPEGYSGSTAAQLTVWIGDQLLFTAEGGGGLLVDIEGRRYLWARSIDQSRQIPFGRIARYEIEDQGGGERTIFFGVVNGLGGLNLDLAAEQPEGALNFNSPAQSGLTMMGWI